MPGLTGLSGLSGLSSVAGGKGFVTPDGEPITDNDGVPITPGNIDDLTINDVEFATQPGAPATPATGLGRLYSVGDNLYFIADTGEIYGPFGGSTILGSGALTGNYHYVGVVTQTWYDLPGMTTTFTAPYSGLYVARWKLMYRQIQNAWYNVAFGIWVDGVSISFEQQNLSAVRANTLRVPYSGHRVMNLTAGSHTVALRYYWTAEAEYTNGLITVSR